MYLFSILVILLRNLKNLHFMESFGVIASYAIFIYLFIYLLLFRVAPAAYGGSQARG